MESHDGLRTGTKQQSVWQWDTQQTGGRWTPLGRNGTKDRYSNQNKPNNQQWAIHDGRSANWYCEQGEENTTDEGSTRL